MIARIELAYGWLLIAFLGSDICWLRSPAVVGLEAWPHDISHLGLVNQITSFREAHSTTEWIVRTR